MSACGGSFSSALADDERVTFLSLSDGLRRFSLPPHLTLQITQPTYMTSTHPQSHTAMLARIMGSGSSSSSISSSSHQLIAPPSPLPSTHPTPQHHQIISTTQQKLSSAIFYGTASFLIIFLNKLILGSTNKGFYGFPSFSFLAVTQFLTTSACLWGCKKAGKIQITELNADVLRIMSPLVLISLANVISGLGGTQKINLPMFTVLRRFSIFFTMVSK